MSDPAFRFLQQDNNRLKKEVGDLKQEVASLYSYLDLIKTLYWANQTIAAEENLLYALNQLLYKVMVVVTASDASITRLDKATDELIFLLVHGQLSQQLSGYRIKSNTGIMGWVVSQQEPIIVNDPRQDWRFSQLVDNEFSFYSQSIASAPIMNNEQLIGVIQLLNKRGNKFNEADLTLLLILAQTATLVFNEIENRLASGRALAEEFFM